MKSTTTMLFGIAIILIGIGLAILSVTAAVEQQFSMSDGFRAWASPCFFGGALVVIGGYMASVLKTKTNAPKESRIPTEGGASAPATHPPFPRPYEP